MRQPFDQLTLDRLHNRDLRYATAYGICKGILEALLDCGWVPEKEKDYVRTRLSHITRELEK